MVDQRSNSDEARSNHILIECVRDRQVSEKNVQRRKRWSYMVLGYLAGARSGVDVLHGKERYLGRYREGAARKLRSAPAYC